MFKVKSLNIASVDKAVEDLALLCRTGKMANDTTILENNLAVSSGKCKPTL